MWMYVPAPQFILAQKKKALTTTPFPRDSLEPVFFQMLGAKCGKEDKDEHKVGILSEHQ